MKKPNNHAPTPGTIKQGITGNHNLMINAINSQTPVYNITINIHLNNAEQINSELIEHEVCKALKNLNHKILTNGL